MLASAGTITHSDPQLQRLHERLNEINRKIMVGELDIPPEHERSPSPEPIYDAHGIRQNTREIRCVCVCVCEGWVGLVGHVEVCCVCQNEQQFVAWAHQLIA